MPAPPVHLSIRGVDPKQLLHVEQGDQDVEDGVAAGSRASKKGGVLESSLGKLASDAAWKERSGVGDWECRFRNALALIWFEGRGGV